jgi:tetrahydromethanopterin S-methyltransferase subunit G
MAKKITIEDLALMIQRGFDETAKKAGVDKRFGDVNKRFDDVDRRFDEVDKRFEQVDNRLDHMDARLSNIEQDIAEIRKHFVYRYEFEDLMARVKYLEQKLGIQSGK